MLEKINILLNSKQKKRLMFLFFLIFTSSILEMIGVGSIPVFLGLLLDPVRLIDFLSDYKFLSKIINLDYKQQIIYSGLTLLIFFTLKNSFLFFVNYYQAKLSKDLNVQNAKKLFDRYIYSSYSNLLKRNPATITRNISGDVINANLYVISLINLIREISLVVVILLLLIFIDFFSTFLIFLIMVLFTCIFYFFVRKKIIQLSSLNQKLRGTQIRLINHIFGSIKETKIYSKEEVFNKLFASSTQGVERINFFNQIINRIPRLLIEVFFIFGILLIILFNILSQNQIETIIPTLTFLGIAVIRLMPAFGSIITLINGIKKTEISFNLITNELKEHLLNKDFNYKQNKTASRFLNLKDSIRFKNVSFKYDEKDDFILKNINFEIKNNQSTAIVGRSGSGKTTLINLILGLLKPSSGEIFLDSNDLKNSNKSWHDIISIVPQDVYLFDDTIKNNIIFDNDEKKLDNDFYKKVLERSKLNEFISKLPDQDNTVVGNQGLRISGGQRQRIGIARALFRNKKILILDEATSSLDLETEKKLIQDLFNIDEKLTLIVITHRLKTVEKFDKIYLVKNKSVTNSNNFNFNSIEDILM